MRNKRQLQLWITLMTFVVSWSSSPAQQERTIVHPEDTGVALENPDMGWVFHYYDNRPSHYGSKLAASDTIDDFPGLTVIYFRIPWSYIEPEEGKFNWSVLDTPAQRWIAKGKQIALRISCSESFMRYATPQWVEEAGTVAVFVDDGFDVGTLYVGPPGKAKIRTENVTFALAEPLVSSDFESGIKPGSYEVYISVGTRTGTPRITLPLPDGDGDRRYRLGTLKILPDRR